MANTAMLISLVLLAEALAGRAMAQSTLLQPTSFPLSDRFTERVPVSGHTLVGVVQSRGPGMPSTVGLGDGTIAVYAPMNSSICVRVTTQDGRYYAENTFGKTGSDAQVDPGNVVMAALAWPSHQLKSDLDAIRLNELAVLAMNGKCGQTGSVLPASIGTSPAVNEPFLQIFANTHGAATWAVLRDPERGGPALRRVRCMRSETGDRVAFDVVCPLGEAPVGLPLLELRLEQQSRDGRSVEVVEKVTLSLPDTPALKP